MKLSITFISPRRIKLHTGYFSQIQAMIYKHLPQELGQWLHDTGFEYNSRRFKLFVFSDINGKRTFNKTDKTFLFEPRITIDIASPVDQILTGLGEGMLKSNDLFLGNNQLMVESVSTAPDPDVSGNSVEISTITPIEVHSTMIRENNRKYTHYYSPFEPEFQRLINQNMGKKWQALHRSEVPGDVTLTPVIPTLKQQTRSFKTATHNTIINGWSGRFKLTAPPKLIQFALNSGLGSRNSQGFGMIGLI